MQPDAQFNKVIQLIEENNLSQAETLCRTVLTSNAKDINILALLGAILLKGNRLDEAESILLDVVRVAPTFARPKQDLAILNMNRGDFEKAAGYFRAATEADPDLSSAYSGLSQALTRLGDRPFRNPGSLTVIITAEI